MDSALLIYISFAASHEYICMQKEEARQAPSVSLARMHVTHAAMLCPLFVFIMDRGSRGGDLQTSHSGFAAFSCGDINGKSSLFPPRYRGER